jgi:DNA-directed RNA polymerase subunit K/omega
LLQYQCQLPPSSTEETSEADMKPPTKAMEELVLSNLKIKEENKNLEHQLQELQLANSKC